MMQFIQYFFFHLLYNNILTLFKKKCRVLFRICDIVFKGDHILDGGFHMVTESSRMELYLNKNAVL